MTASVESPPVEEIGYFTHVDPRVIKLGSNVRTIEDIERERPRLLASVKERGVRHAVTANETAEGLVLRVGFSRVLAAIRHVHLHPTIPVHVLPADDDAAERLIDQVEENDNREGLTSDELATALDQLALELPVEDIARKLAIDESEVRAAVTVRASAAARDVVAENPQISMEYAAAFAEFEDDPEATAALQERLEEDPEEFGDEVLYQRRLHQEATERAALAEQLAADGITVVERDRFATSTQRALDDLCPDDGDRTSFHARGADSHRDCPGHAAAVGTDRHGLPQATYLCQNWQQHGHVLRWPFTTTQPETPQSRQKSEYEKAELRRVKENNTRWRAAETERREFLGRLLKRTTPPKAAQQFLATELVAGDHWLRRALEGHWVANKHQMACTLLGLPEPAVGTKHPLQPTKKATVNEAVMTQLAVVLGAYEQATSTETWRSPDEAMVRYFTQLNHWGHALSAVEKLVLDPGADTHRWAHLQPATDDGDAESARGTVTESDDPRPDGAPLDAPTGAGGADDDGHPDGSEHHDESEDEESEDDGPFDDEDTSCVSTLDDEAAATAA